MNTLQTEYTEIKAAYEAAFTDQKWNLVDELEDKLLDAEFNLVDWSLEQVIKTGKMSADDAAFIRKNSNSTQWDKMIDLALRLKN